MSFLFPMADLGEHLEERYGKGTKLEFENCFVLDAPKVFVGYTIHGLYIEEVLSKTLRSIEKFVELKEKFEAQK